ncbi:endonuclease V [Gandjariella thermophila]|uniref:Endonuclease V n=1 Tax=Gandjariella thermophila TaxID=1931992 RepID=A0A4D4J1B4_9PSEU|nr:endonuclease V [Gandjariella thermophila]
MDEAVRMQDLLRPLVDARTPAGFAPRTVAGLDVAYAVPSGRLAAAAVVLDIDTLRPVDTAVVLGEARFPYVSGVFAFRELPALLDALERLATTPDVMICDGQGVAHPRRFGLACHIGLLTGIPTVGVAKQAMVGYRPPGPRRGDWSPLVDDGEVVGRALRTQDGVKPVFVSVGHRIDLGAASDLVLRLCPRFRLPETTRQADYVARRLLGAE